MKNYNQDGDRVIVAAPYALTSGDGAIVGGIFGVAMSDAANGANVVLVVEGIVTLTKVGSQAWAVGDAIYWDAANKRCTKVGTGSQLIGVATAAVDSGSGDTAGDVRLTGVQHPQAGNVADATAGSAAEINALRDALIAAGLMASA